MMGAALPKGKPSSKCRSRTEIAVLEDAPEMGASVEVRTSGYHRGLSGFMGRRTEVIPDRMRPVLSFGRHPKGDITLQEPRPHHLKLHKLFESGRLSVLKNSMAQGSLGGK